MVAAARRVSGLLFLIDEARGAKHCLGAARVNALAAVLSRARDMHRRMAHGGRRRGGAEIGGTIDPTGQEMPAMIFFFVSSSIVVGGVALRARSCCLALAIASLSFEHRPR
jgi:hypothetical protein